MPGTLTSALANLKTRNKLALGFSLVLTLTLAIAALGYLALNRLHQGFLEASELAGINIQIYEARRSEKDFALRNDDSYLGKAHAAIAKLDEIAGANLADETDPAHIQVLQGIRDNSRAYDQHLNDFASAYHQRDQAQGAMNQAAQQAGQGLDKLRATLDEDTRGQLEFSGDSLALEVFNLASGAGALNQRLIAARDIERRLLRGDEQAAAALEQELQALSQSAAQLREQLGNEQQQQLMAVTEQALQQYQQQLAAYHASRRAYGEAEGQMRDSARAVMEAADGSYNEHLSTLEQQSNAAERLILISAAVAFVIGVLATWLISTLIVRPLRHAVSAAQRIAAGDLSGELDGRRKDEIGQLMLAMGDMTRSLRQLLQQMASGITQIATAAEELSAVTEQSNVGINQQKLETDQVASAMQQMAATVQEVARHAETASDSAQQADQRARQGDGVVGQTITRIETLAEEVGESAEAIAQLQTETQNIGGVLDVIKAVAEQTNLLALNAAIEAARAGEQGRGFAVVADEVRALAVRTQSSTAEIEQLIKRLQGGVERAVQRMDRSRDIAEQSRADVHQAGKALRAITDAVTSIQQFNQQIATAAEQQSAVATEISRSVTSIRDVAEQSASASEETAASSIDLARLGGELQMLVGRFRIA